MIFPKLLLALCLALLASASPVTNASNNAVDSPPMSSDIGRHRGIAYNNPDFVKYFYVKNAQVGWYYNWYRIATGVNAQAWEYVPMLWGIDPDMTAGWNSGWKHAADENPDMPTHLLSFNEPDNCQHGAGGSCLSVAEAVAAWITYMEPAKTYKDKMYLGSPAVTNSGSPTMGLAWLQAFLAACSKCSIDFICIHWYAEAKNVAYFKSYIDEVKKVAQNRPIWITEFRPSGNDAEVKKFLDEVLPWMDKNDAIHRYAYFMAREESLVNAEGTGLSEIGKQYIYQRKLPDGSNTTSPE